MAEPKTDLTKISMWPTSSRPCPTKSKRADCKVLGKHKTASVCLHLKRLSDVD